VVVVVFPYQQNQVFHREALHIDELLDLGINKFYKLYSEFPVALAIHPDRIDELSHKYAWRGIALYATDEIAKDEVYCFARMVVPC